jgi:hypothetical protein
MESINISKNRNNMVISMFDVKKESGTKDNSSTAQTGWPKNCDYPTWWGYLPYRDDTVEKLDREYFAAKPK